MEPKLGQFSGNISRLLVRKLNPDPLSNHCRQFKEARADDGLIHTSGHKTAPPAESALLFIVSLVADFPSNLFRSRLELLKSADFGHIHAVKLHGNFCSNIWIISTLTSNLSAGTDRLCNSIFLPSRAAWIKATSKSPPSTAGQVTWSKQKGNRSGLRIEKGIPLHQDSLARYVTEPSGKMGPTAVDSDVWITHNWYGRRIEVTEQGWTMDGYNSVLTLLVVTDSDEPAEEDMVGHYQRKMMRRRFRIETPRNS